jgi:phosphatidylglycerol lysyltransferase
MFTREAQNWITLGDPIGPETEAQELIWQFYDECTNDGYDPVFYQVGERYLEYYVDLGLTIYKLGEEARIPLNGFNPKQSIDAKIWSGYQLLDQEGYSFEMIDSSSMGRYLPELKAISNASLNAQQKKERGFSVGYFDESYLSNFPIAVVKKNETPLAFSNILQGADRYELATDLLRYRPEAPAGIIDYMLINTMLWGQKHDYEWFNLGMAPLSGMNEHDFSPGWNKLANFVYTYGENIYEFKKVRTYKSQFNPKWEPKFLIAPGGWTLPRVLSNLTNVVSGGFSSIVSK